MIDVKQYIKFALNYGFENGFCFYTTKSKYSSFNVFVFKKPKKEKDLQLLESKNLNDLLELLDTHKYLHFVCDKKDFFKENVFILQYMKESKENKKYLLKNLNYYINYINGESLIIVLDKISNSFKDVVQNINNIKISLFQAKTVEFNDLHNFLIKKGGTEEQILNFYVSFFNKRKNQLKSNNLGYKFKKFILKTFKEEEKIKLFINISNYIKEEFVENNFFENEVSDINSEILHINYSKLLEKMCNPKYSILSLKYDLELLANEIVSYKNLEFFEVYNIDKKKNKYEFIFFHKQKTNQKEIEGIFFDFLKFIKENQHIEVNSNIINNWLLQKDLYKDLTIKNSNNKKLKI